MLKILRNPILWLLLILVLAFTVRLYKIDNPIGEWHGWRQADTAAVSRNFYQDGFNPFIPRYDDMSGVAEKPVPNPNGYRFVEFPIYNSLVYFGYLVAGGVDERIARLINVLFSLGSLIFVYLIGRKYFGTMTGLLSALTFAILPFNIFFSRVILPEPSLVFFSLGMFYFVNAWIWKNSTIDLCWALGFTTLAFLTKPYAIFYLLPLIYSYYQKEGKMWPIPKKYWIFGLTILPFIGWRIWMSQFPEGIPASKWLFNGTRIRFKPAFWRWIIGDRFGREILSVAGSLLFFLGLLVRPAIGQGWQLHLLALSLLGYLLVFATGNVQHDYYQVLIIPILAIFLARGFMLLIQGENSFIARIWTIPLAILLLTCTFYLSWLEVKGLYQINNPDIIVAGQEADRILPKSAKVVAPYSGDTTFLYYINRLGWPVVGLPLEELIEDYDIDYLVSTSKDQQTKEAMAKYTILVDNNKYVIVDLTKSNPNYQAP